MASTTKLPALRREAAASAHALARPAFRVGGGGEGMCRGKDCLLFEDRIARDFYATLPLSPT